MNDRNLCVFRPDGVFGKAHGSPIICPSLTNVVSVKSFLSTLLVPDSDFDIVGELEAELAKHAARVNHSPRAIGRGLVPDWRQTKYRPRITRAQRADYQVVHFGSVLHDHHVLTLRASIAELGDRAGSIRQQVTLIIWINPRARDYPRTVARAHFVFVGVYQRIERAAIHQTFVDKEGFESFDPKSQVGGNGLVFVIVLILVVQIGGHRRSRSRGHSRQEIASRCGHRGSDLLARVDRMDRKIRLITAPFWSLSQKMSTRGYTRGYGQPV